MSHSDQPNEPNRWPHFVSVLLVCATFPLIWVGGLVTTMDAGMAVPDWPSTYGYNLFLYPWQTWIFGPFDLFVEHGHRLLGATVGLIAMAMVAAVWRFDSRRWVRWLSVAALGLVIIQGLLGGMRVIENDVALAKIHGCVGPAFFALAVVMAAVTSRWWHTGQTSPEPHGNRTRTVSLATALLIYVQIVIGAHLRHLPIDWSPNAFRLTVVFHLVMATAIVGHVVYLTATMLLHHRRQRKFVAPAIGLGLLILAQLGLGMGTWVAEYSWPTFMQQFDFTAGHLNIADGLVSAMIVTAHQAMGSLLLGLSVLLSMRTWRLLSPESASAPFRFVRLSEAIA